jgi:hypothetical protein
MVQVYVHRYRPVDPRLGRHVRHDLRSAQYAVGVKPRSAIQTVKWARRIPILDQGSIGDCVSNALTGVLGTDSRARTGLTSVTVPADPVGVFDAGTYPLDEAFALRMYSLVTALDAYPGQYPPTDTGSDGLGAMAAAQALGLAVRYLHAFSVSAVKSALQDGPVLWGTLWLNSMFTTDSDGFLVVDRSSGEAGGHELTLTGYNRSTDVYDGDNSWGTSFGIGGSFKIQGSDLKWLLTQGGDITVPVWSVTPSPVPPPTVTDAEFWRVAKAWAAGKNLT